MGPEALETLAQKHVAIFGVGGVGGYVAEALARSGVGTIEIIDNDDISLTNLNRQIIATRSTVGQVKVTAMANRIRDINPDIQVIAHRTFYMPEQAEHFDFSAFDYVVDAIDTVTAKLHLAEACARRGVPLYMCLGTGNRLDPGALRIGDIADTAGCGCGLARVMRRELKRRGVARQTVLYSVEEPAKAVCPGEHGRHAPGSIAFVPPAAGFLLASRAVRDLLGL